MSEKTKKWLAAAGVRALKTVCQSAVAAIGAAAVIYAGLLRLLGALRREDILLMPCGEHLCLLLRL